MQPLYRFYYVSSIFVHFSGEKIGFSEIDKMQKSPLEFPLCSRSMLPCCFKMIQHPLHLYLVQTLELTYHPFCIVCSVRNVRNGQPRSRSLTELELEAVASSTRVAPRVDPLAGNQTNSVQGKAHEDVKSNAGDGSDIPNGTARKLRSVSNVDAATFETRGGGGSGVFEEICPPRHNNT